MVVFISMSKLLYTLGRDDIYMPYMKTKNPKKGIGGRYGKRMMMLKSMLINIILKDIKYMV